MNTLPILHSSAITIFTILDREKERDRLNLVLEQNTEQRNKVFSIILPFNSKKYEHLQRTLAELQDLNAELAELNQKQSDESKPVAEKLIERAQEVSAKTKKNEELSKLCKALYKKILQKVHPDKIKEVTSQTKSFTLLAKEYLDALDHESLTLLVTTVNDYFGSNKGLNSEKDSEPQNPLALKLLKIERDIESVHQKLGELANDDFTKVVCIFESYGQTIAVSTYRQILDAQIDFYSQQAASIKKHIRMATQTYTEFDVDPKPYSFES